MWTGSFELSNLDAVLHRVELSPHSHYAIDPKGAEATPAIVSDAGAFVVRDLHEYVPVVLRIRQPSGAPRNSCYATFTPRYQSRENPVSGFFRALPPAGSGPAPGEPGAVEGHTLSTLFPRGEKFDVVVQSNGYERLELTQEEFQWDGSQIGCERILTIERD